MNPQSAPSQVSAHQKTSSVCFDHCVCFWTLTQGVGFNLKNVLPRSLHIVGQTYCAKCWPTLDRRQAARVVGYRWVTHPLCDSWVATHPRPSISPPRGPRLALKALCPLLNTTLLPRCDQAWELSDHRQTLDQTHTMLPHWPWRADAKNATVLHYKPTFCIASLTILLSLYS